jgi:hypothetical protein
MSIAPVITPTPPVVDAIQPFLAWQAASVEGLTQMQRLQFDLLAGWWRPVAQFQREAWMQWAAHFGVPFDG